MTNEVILFDGTSDVNFLSLEATKVKVKEISPIQIETGKIRFIQDEELKSVSSHFKALRKTTNHQFNRIKLKLEKGGKQAKNINLSLAQKILVQGDLKALTNTFDVVDQCTRYFTASQFDACFKRAIGYTPKRTISQIFSTFNRKKQSVKNMQILQKYCINNHSNEMEEALKKEFNNKNKKGHVFHFTTFDNFYTFDWESVNKKTEETPMETITESKKGKKEAVK